MKKKGVSIKLYKEVIGCEWMVVEVITNNQDLGFMLLLLLLTLLTLNTHPQYQSILKKCSSGSTSIG